MRTVTFSDEGVVKQLNEHFVCAWVNKRPDRKFRDGTYANLKCPLVLRNGVGVTNVTAVFAAADGTVIHAMPGYLDVPTFKKHLEFARDLHARLFDPEVVPEDRPTIHADAHRKSAEEATVKLEKDAHALLSARFMRVDEMPLTFFNEVKRTVRFTVPP